MTLTSSASSIAENSGSTITLTATISQVADEDVTVNLGTSGTATNGTDYGSLSSITVSAGATTGTATFNPTDDSLSEGSQTAIISISSVSGADAAESGSQSVTITITDNESSPTITLATSATSIAENAGSSLTLTATSSIAADEDITVSISTSGTGIASTEGTDYSNISDITISAGATTGTASFTPIDDSIYEENESSIISISGVSGGNASESGSQSVTITITENESAPAISLSVSSNSIAEDSGGNVTITATTSVQWPDTTELSINIANPGGTASGTDYNISPPVGGCCISFPGGQSSATTTFTPVDDSIYEGNEAVILEINSIAVTSGGFGGRDAVIAGGSQTETITIVDDESVGSVSLSASASSTAENGSDITITASITTASKEDVVVNLSAAGTATSGTDYAAISSITIAAGQTSGTAAFNPTDDNAYEGNETAIFTISSITGNGQESGTQSLTLTIVENESTPTSNINFICIKYCRKFWFFINTNSNNVCYF